MKLIVWSILSFMLMLYAMPAPAQQASAAAGRPNIIFILTDDQRWDAAGYAGNRIILTPEMDKLAAEGTAFVNAFVTTPICAASRASFLTGLYERTHRFTFGVDRIVDEHMNLSYPKLMKESGYYTGFYGKLGVKFDERDDLFDQFEFYDRNIEAVQGHGHAAR